MYAATNLRNRATALALAGLLSGLLAGCGGDGDDTDPVAADPETTSSAPTEPTSPADTPADTPTEDTPTSDDGSAGTVAAPVYFVGNTPLGKRLYREFRQVPGDNPLEAAAALLVAGDALDPDYSTLLPDLPISSVTDEGGTIVVDLAADAVTDDKTISPDDAVVAVQSLVYTLQGAAENRDPVQVRVGGVPTPLFGQPTDAGVEAADELDVLALVNVTEPATDATVSGSFTASGVASSFEATVPWELRDDSDTVVLDGFATAEGWADKLYPWETEVDLSGVAPGSYTFAARTDDPSDGEGPGPFEDTKTITVE